MSNLKTLPREVGRLGSTSLLSREFSHVLFLRLHGNTLPVIPQPVSQRPDCRASVRRQNQSFSYPFRTVCPHPPPCPQCLRSFRGSRSLITPGSGPNTPQAGRQGPLSISPLCHSPSYAVSSSSESLRNMITGPHFFLPSLCTCHSQSEIPHTS